MQRNLIVITLVVFGTLTGAALWKYGYWGIFIPPFQSLYAGQILADLTIALTMVMFWMWHDAKAVGRNIWPWIIGTLAFGSFAPLLYLLTRQSPVNLSTSAH